MVSILIFIDHDILIEISVFFEDIMGFLEKLNGEGEDIVEIKGVCSFHSLLINVIYLGNYLRHLRNFLQ